MAYDIQMSNEGEEVREMFYSGFGILCLTRDPVSILMWSHYGRNHTGFAVEFDYRFATSFNDDNSEYVLENKLLTVPVAYTDTRPEFKSLSEINSPYHGFLEKASCWAYEKEERSIVPVGNRNISFDPSLVSAVLLGARCSNETEDEINCAVDLHNKNTEAAISIYNLKLHDSRYRLTIPGHPYFDSVDYHEVA
jgi:hypothetical protein